MHGEGTRSLLKMRGEQVRLQRGGSNLSVASRKDESQRFRPASADEPRNPNYSHSMTCRRIHQARHGDIYLYKY